MEVLAGQNSFRTSDVDINEICDHKTVESTMANNTKVIAEVNEMKEVLLKELPAESDASVERCKDVLSALQKTPMSLDILTETMVGATVNKLKSHQTLGPTVKQLVKQWKQLAKHAKPTAERRKSDSSQQDDPEEGSSYNPESEWSSLPDHRSSICKKLYDILLLSKPALRKQGVAESVMLHLMGPRAAEVEHAIYNAFRNNRKAYMDKARSISFNLKKNTKLAVSLLLGQMEASAMVQMSAEELASDDARKTRQTVAQKLIDSKRLDWEQANESKINEQCGITGDLLQASLFTCGRCKSVKTTSTQKQTRSADEPMTVFVLCLNCGKRWKC